MPTMERRQSAGRRESDPGIDELETMRLVLGQATQEIVALRMERNQALAHVERLMRAGDELASSLSRSPGIDPMRSLLLARWRDAKAELPDG